MKKKNSNIPTKPMIISIALKEKRSKNEYDEGFDKGMAEEGAKLKKRNKKMTKVMREFEEGKLRSGSKKGPKVKSRKQALAIGYEESKRANKKRKKK